MSNLELGLWSFPALLVLIFLRIPIALAMLVTGLVGTYLIMGSPTPILSRLKGETYSTFSSYSLSIIPLFLLMGQFASLGGMSQSLFNAANSWLGHRKGGVAMSAIGACAGFGAICGSSLATAATMAQVALPELKRYGYSGALATGTLAAGGTLGILIPPSGPMILYAVVTNASIGGLFLAGLLPGLMIALFFAVFSWFQANAHGETRAQDWPGFRAVFAAFWKSIWAVLMPPVILGGIYLGIFTAAEAAAIGAAYALFVAIAIYRNVSLRDLADCTWQTMRTCAMLFMIIAAAGMFGHAITIIRLPAEVMEAVTALGLSQTGFILIVMVAIFILGMFLETIAIILITTPIILPAMLALDINPIWYGVMLMINLELALITPPVGMNLYVIKGITGAPLTQIMRGAAPYVAILIVGLFIVWSFPQLALWLPQQSGFGR